MVVIDQLSFIHTGDKYQKKVEQYDFIVRELKELAKEYARFLEGSDLSGFNVLKFDIPVLVEEFLRADVDFDYAGHKKDLPTEINRVMEINNNVVKALLEKKE